MRPTRSPNFFAPPSQNYFTLGATTCIKDNDRNTITTSRCEGSIDIAIKWRRCLAVAWMRMMGADSVGYHERTVLGREDDPVGNALEYYRVPG